MPVRFPVGTPQAARAAQTPTILLEHLHHAREPLGEHNGEQLRPGVHTPLAKGDRLAGSGLLADNSVLREGCFVRFFFMTVASLSEIQPDDAIGSGDRRHLSTISGTSPGAGFMNVRQ